MARERENGGSNFPIKVRRSGAEENAREVTLTLWMPACKEKEGEEPCGNFLDRAEGGKGGFLLRRRSLREKRGKERGGRGLAEAGFRKRLACQLEEEGKKEDRFVRQ